MVPILSFKLLPNRDSYGVGTSLVRESSFGGKILGTSCLLMLFPSRFTLPRKVKHSVQILMTWDNWGRSSLLEMSLLFLRFIWLFVTSQIANSTLRNAHWTFFTFRSLRSWAFIGSCQIYLLHFFQEKSEQFWGFLHVFILVLKFSKVLGFCQTLFAISDRSLLIILLFPHLCQVLEWGFSSQVRIVILWLFVGLYNMV